MITERQFRAMMPNGKDRLDAHWPYIVPALVAGQIDSPMRIAAFMAQLAHESGEYRYMEELADGSAYEGRVEGLGNTQPGDGPRFKGRGPIQITGRAAYDACGRALGLGLLSAPQLLTQPQHGTKGSAWFWREWKPWLNRAADMGWFRVTTRLVNGAYTHLAERLRFYESNRALLGLGRPYTEDEEEESIKRFQQAHGLVVDGDAGRNTLAALLSE